MTTGIVAHFNPNGIPDYLKQRPQWIVWGKRTKQYQDALLEDGKLNWTSSIRRTRLCIHALTTKDSNLLNELFDNSSGQDGFVLPTNHKPTFERGDL